MTGEFDPQRALELVYGGTTWSDQRLSQYGFEDDFAFVEQLFDAPFEEQGVSKHLVVVTLTPKPRSQFNCHACAPLLGGAIFRRDGDAWIIDSTGRVIEFGHAWYGTHSRLALIQIGAEKFGLVHQIDDRNGGYEFKRASLIFALGDELAARFSAPDLEGPGPGACGIPSEQHLRLNAVSETSLGAGDADGYFDLILDAQWNDARCEQVELDGGEIGATFSGSACHRMSRYSFRDEVYALAATELDECNLLPPGVVSVRG